MFLAGVPSAHAQSDGDRARNVSVRDRAKALYGAEGVRAGAFLAYPSVEVYENYYSNVFAAPTDEISDYSTQLNLGVALNSNWSTHRLDVGINASSRFFQDLNSQDTTDVTAFMSGRLDVTRDAHVNGDFTVHSGNEAIAFSPTGDLLGKPIEFDREAVGLGYSHAFNRVRLSGSGRMDKYDYKDGELLGGGLLEQDDRDVDVSRVSLRADYALTPSTALFVAASRNWRKHDLTAPTLDLTRDSDGEEYLAGIRFDLTDLLIGEIGAGQFKQSYDAPGVGETTSSTVRANLEWYPDELVTVTLAAAREAGDSGVVGAAGFISDTMSLRADYEFRRNIILGLGVSEVENDYVGVNRLDQRRSYDVSLDYIVSRRWSAFVSFARYEQDSTGDAGFVGREFELDQFTVGVRLVR